MVAVLSAVPFDDMPEGDPGSMAGAALGGESQLIGRDSIARESNSSGELRLARGRSVFVRQDSDAGTVLDLDEFDEQPMHDARMAREFEEHGAYTHMQQLETELQETQRLIHSFAGDSPVL